MNGASSPGAGGTEPTGALRERRLVQAFVQMADTLVDDYDIGEVLHQLVEHCVTLLDAAAAGLMMSDQRGGLRVLASSTEQTRMLELFQLQADEGPCLDCYRTGEPVLVDDLTTVTERWPSFAPEAIKAGFRAVHAVPLRLRLDTIGALNLFNRHAGSPPDQDIQVARALADTATIGILQERAIRRGEILTEQLQTALNNRTIIEQAKGVLAHAGDTDTDHAFQALRAHGRRYRVRLTDVAYQLTTGALDPALVLGRRGPSGDVGEDR